MPEDKLGFSVIVTRNHLTVLDYDFNIYSKYQGLNITDAIQINSYLYVVNETMHSVRETHIIADGSKIEGYLSCAEKGKALSAINMNMLLN